MERRQQSLAKQQQGLEANGSHTPLSAPEARSTSISYEYSGSVAHPSIVAGWEEVVPGAGVRILAESEKQSAHRRHIEKVLVWGRTIGSNAGTFGGITVTLLAMYLGYDLLMHDKEVAGFAAFFGPLAALVWAYRRETKAPTPAPKARKSQK